MWPICDYDDFNDYICDHVLICFKLMSTTIGDHVVIGTNATMLPVTVCDHVVIGAGSVVTRNITDTEIYAGNPATRIGDYVH
jgi:acetyltransferase-like isoleucine patch superfamily enzyme